jgi:hypothetical protein
MNQKNPKGSPFGFFVVTVYTLEHTVKVIVRSKNRIKPARRQN